MPDSAHRCGYVALVGRPNVGKSTLLNHLLGQKICITSRKPQTTRHAILGIKSEPGAQLIFVDTPGQHSGERSALNRSMNRAALRAMRDVDVIVLVLDRLRITDEDERVIERVRQVGVPVVVAINKTDRLEDPATLLPHLEALQQRLPDAGLVPVSALQRHNLDSLEAEIVARLPEGEAQFPEEQVTDRSVRFITAELIREKIMRQLGEEVPYAAAVEIEQWQQDGRLTRIHALILVEKEGQKAILIGEQGARLKAIGTAARRDIEKLLGNKVMLQLWVTVRSGWSDDERALRSLGYADGS